MRKVYRSKSRNTYQKELELKVKINLLKYGKIYPYLIFDRSVNMNAS